MEIKLNDENLPFDIHATKNPVFDLLPGITVFAGCNGHGKSTTIKQIARFMQENNHPYLYYDATMHDINTVTETDMLTYCLQASEGERVYAIFGEFVAKIRKERERCKWDSRPMVLLIDGIDGGLSIDVIIEIRNFLCFILHEIIEYGVLPYICIATNSYELCNEPDYFNAGIFEYNKELRNLYLAKYFRCCDACNFEYLKFSSYTEYHKYIMKTSKMKSERIAKFFKDADNKKKGNVEE